MIMRWEKRRWAGRWTEIEGSPVFFCPQFMSHFTFKRSRCTSYNVQQLKIQRLCWETLLHILEDRQRICQLGIKITSSQIQTCPCILLQVTKMCKWIHFRVFLSISSMFEKCCLALHFFFWKFPWNPNFSHCALWMETHLCWEGIRKVSYTCSVSGF